MVHSDDEDKELLTLLSHSHPISTIRQAQHWDSGAVFATGSEDMARVLQKIAENPGSKLVLRACAQLPGWENIVEVVRVTAREIYEPLF